MRKRHRRDSSNNSKLNMSGLSSVRNGATTTKKNHSIPAVGHTAASSRNKLVHHIFEKSNTTSIKSKKMEDEPAALFRDADSEDEGNADNLMEFDEP